MKASLAPILLLNPDDPFADPCRRFRNWGATPSRIHFMRRPRPHLVRRVPLPPASPPLPPALVAALADAWEPILLERIMRRPPPPACRLTRIR